jgi:hypothetical protein
MEVLLQSWPLLKAFEIDWGELMRFWSLTWQYEALKNENLIDAYAADWFRLDQSGRNRFIIPKLEYHDPLRPIWFTNGTHRARVIAGLQKTVPMSLGCSIYRRKRFDCMIVREIPRDAHFEIPDLPVTWNL